MFHAPVRANGGRQKGAAGVFAVWLAPKKNYLSLAPQHRARSRECGAHSRRGNQTRSAVSPLPPAVRTRSATEKRRLPKRHARLSPHALPRGTQQGVANPLGLSLARLANRLGNLPFLVRAEPRAQHAAKPPASGTIRPASFATLFATVLLCETAAAFDGKKLHFDQWNQGLRPLLMKRCETR